MRNDDWGMSVSPCYTLLCLHVTLNLCYNQDYQLCLFHVAKDTLLDVSFFNFTHLKEFKLCIYTNNSITLLLFIMLLCFVSLYPLIA